MAPLIVLLVVTTLARCAGWLGVPALRTWAAATRAGLAVMFLFTATAHFTAMRADLMRMVPPWVPEPGVMVTLTGSLEAAGAIGLLVPRTRKLAAAALVLLLVALLPANIHAALAGVTIRGAAPTPLVPRVALQVLFIALVWWSGVHRAFDDARPGDARPGL